jgi:hypothetical protein
MSIYKDILALKPAECTVRFHKVSYDGFTFTHYNEYTRTCNIILGPQWYEAIAFPKKWKILHSVLHEICHDITWNPAWNREYHKLIKHRWTSGGTHYMVEYKAEKLLRQICKKNKWAELLHISDHLISTINTTKNKFPYLFAYDYMASRIIREESLLLSVV